MKKYTDGDETAGERGLHATVIGIGVGRRPRIPGQDYGHHRDVESGNPPRDAGFPTRV